MLVEALGQSVEFGKRALSVVNVEDHQSLAEFDLGIVLADNPELGIEPVLEADPGPRGHQQLPARGDTSINMTSV